MQKRKLRICATTWHVMHYWDMFNALKDHADFYLIHNTNRQWKDKRFLAARPIPENATFVPYYEKGKYDLALLNVDQQLVNPEIGKRKVYKELNETITDIPKIVINHGTPVYPEYLQVDDMTAQDAEDECRRRMRDLVGDNTMVVNSHDAAKEWGWGTPIVHGMNPDEWFDLPKEPRVFTALSIGGMDEYYNRLCMVETKNILEKKYGINLWWAKQNVATHLSVEKYKDFLGRSLIYLDTSFRTPMNRARTEAMLSGSCVVQVKGGHDLDRFATNDENMILVENSPKIIADLIFDLLENRYEECIRIGQNGRKTALEEFSYERYSKDWLALIEDVLA